MYLSYVQVCSDVQYFLLKLYYGAMNKVEYSYYSYGDKCIKSCELLNLFKKVL